MFDPEIAAIRHANEFQAEQGKVDREGVFALAADAEDGDVLAISSLRDIAEECGVEWDEDNIANVAEKIVEKLDANSSGEDDPYGSAL
jgi:hypothetical protein